MAGPKTTFDNDECQSILDVIDRIFDIPQVLFKGIFDPGSGLSVDYSRRLEDYCHPEDKKAIKKLRKAGKFYQPKRKVSRKS